MNQAILQRIKTLRDIVVYATLPQLNQGGMNANQRVRSLGLAQNNTTGMSASISALRNFTLSKFTQVGGTVGLVMKKSQLNEYNQRLAELAKYTGVSIKYYPDYITDPSGEALNVERAKQILPVITIASETSKIEFQEMIKAETAGTLYTSRSAPTATSTKRVRSTNFNNISPYRGKFKKV